jgi:hypothetical protein
MSKSIPQFPQVSTGEASGVGFVGRMVESGSALGQLVFSREGSLAFGTHQVAREIRPLGAAVSDGAGYKEWQEATPGAPQRGQAEGAGAECCAGFPS